MRCLTRLTIALLLFAATTGCRKEEEPRTGELFQAQYRGLTNLATGRLPEAETEFRKVIALAPREALGYANLGLTYLRATRYQEAEARLRRARELEPANVEIGLIAAKLYSLTDRMADARQLLEQLARTAPTNAHVLYALAELDASDTSQAGFQRYETRLRSVLAAAPTNLAVRLTLIDVFARGGKADSAVRLLEDVRRVGPELPKEPRPALDSSIRLLRAGNLVAARPALDRFLHLMGLTSPYQAALDDVKWLDGPLVGRPVLSFTPKYFVTLRASTRGRPPGAVRFVEATSDAGLPELGTSAAGTPPAAIATGDFDGDGSDDLFASFSSSQQTKSVAHLYRAVGGHFADVTARAGLSLPAGAAFATFADADNDGRLDLFVIGGDQRASLLRNAGEGKLQDVTAKSGISNTAGVTKAMFVDVDHDGDLDLLLVGRNGLVVYRNNLDGTFADVSREMGFVTGAPARDASFGDFDGDGRIDVVVLTDKVQLFHNAGSRRFSDATARSGLSATAATAVAVGDYDNDGFLDIVVVGAEPSLWRNSGTGTFTRDRRFAAGGTGGLAAEFLDYDNDGWLDVIVAGRSGTGLFHNDGKGQFTNQSTSLPAGVSGAGIAAVDADGDGDLDLLIADSGVRFLRNDGGNANLSMQLQLVGLRTGSGKNNAFGIGSKIEVRSAELYQTRVVSSRSTHIGLGSHLKADVVRIEWTNGVPQTIYFPGTDQDVTENEMLKGSCAFLYTWDGKRFRFVTDVMWRSALGMPLGLLGSSTAYAPPGASQEYLRVPGDALQPRDGAYTLQLTEELWETAYADQLELIAVDHPDSVDVFTDERFVPPGPVQMRVFHAADVQVPRSAVDERGNDLLPALRAADDVYATYLTPLQYQGVVEPHDLILDLGPNAGRDSTFLFLRGWIYPTDASINVALSQQTALATAMPSLEVRDARGQWKTAIPSIGFPSGKDKTIVVDLAGIFPTNDHHVRIRTNLQIYWDHVFVARNRANSPARITRLKPLSADLHVRGYSRVYRKGDRYGPWWFDYDSLTKVPMWRPIDGSFTRVGDVLPLLGKSDDMYVIMAPGDEITVKFDAASAGALPPGWKRDFLLYTDGWIKDSDLNTAFGTTVGPLPFHQIKAYPYAPGESYPTDSVHQRYMREYNTRTIGRMTRQ